MVDFGIIAGGESSRIINEGSFIPKPLLKIAGQPMIGRLVNIMKECSPRSISIFLNSEMPEVKDYLQNFIHSSGCELRICSGKTESSMHSFYELVQFMKPIDKFVVTTVDTVFNIGSFRNYVEYFLNSPLGIDGVMGVTRYIDDEKPLFVEVEDNQRIVAFKDNCSKKTGFVSAGVYGLQPSSVTVLQECISSGIHRMRNFQRKLLEKKLNLNAFDLGKVIDVDHLSDVEKANMLLHK